MLPAGQRAGPGAARRPAFCALRAEFGRFCLLGTAVTVEQDFYRDRLAGHALNVLVPGTNDRALVHRIIDDEL